MRLGDYFVDRPIFIKSGVTLSGSWIDEAPTFTFLLVYEGSNSRNSGEDGIIVIDGATDAEVNSPSYRSPCNIYIDPPNKKGVSRNARRMLWWDTRHLGEGHEQNAKLIDWSKKLSTLDCETCKNTRPKFLKVTLKQSRF